MTEQLCWSGQNSKTQEGDFFKKVQKKLLEGNKREDDCDKHLCKKTNGVSCDAEKEFLDSDHCI